MLWELIGRLSSTTLTIRISGEIGVGKEAVARLICRHYPSPKAKFHKIDCRQLKIAVGASPMAQLNKLLTSPGQHVIYLENIESAAKEVQHRLLDLLADNPTTSPPWIIVSSLQPLERFLRNDHFSSALFRALDTIHIMLPPLRLKADRIPQILAWFLSHYSHNVPSSSLCLPGMDEMERLIDYHWPRNWRQLQEVAQNAMEKMAWNVPLDCSESGYDRYEGIDDIAAIYILSMARMSIQKEKVMEDMMAVSNLDEIGLLDLAIFNEAANQIAEQMSKENDDDT